MLLRWWKAVFLKLVYIWYWSEERKPTWVISNYILEMYKMQKLRENFVHNLIYNFFDIRDLCVPTYIYMYMIYMI